MADRCRGELLMPKGADFSFEQIATVLRGGANWRQGVRNARRHARHVVEHIRAAIGGGLQGFAGQQEPWGMG